MEGKEVLKNTESMLSPEFSESVEIPDTVVIDDASDDQSDEKNKKPINLLEKTENSAATTQNENLDLEEKEKLPAEDQQKIQTSSLLDDGNNADQPSNSVSRSGDSKRNSKLLNAPVVKKQKQALLNFSSSSGPGPLSLKLKLGPKTPKNDDLKNPKNESSAVQTALPLKVSPKFMVTIPLKKEVNQSGNEVTILQESTSPEVIAVPNSPKESSSKGQKLTFKLKPNVSRTTIIRDKSKLLRSNPGPFVSLNYDLYDDNLITAPINETAAQEKLAFGFPVQKKPWLLDVTYIIAFLGIFKDIVQIGPLGPADFEKGLGLGYNSEEDPDIIGAIPNVSPTMDLLFRKLLALVLNRKKPIARDGQRSALQELKSKYIEFGLPREWRDDTNIHVTNTIVCDTTEDRVDESKPQISAEEAVEFEGPQELFNPFHESGFEKFGLGGITSPEDRCIMMRCLVTWCLSESSTIRQQLADSINKQDTSGERDTFYASRAILKGFSQTIETKKDLQRKFSKKGKQGLPAGGSETFPAYFDPTSDPFNHPLSFRFNEFVVGDCGFHIGRFYLVRMADPSSGRVSSLDQMRGATTDRAGVRLSTPSGFALCVEDVHSVLVESLGEFGVEFDKEGNEVESNINADESHHWYCVASNCEQLESFLAHISKVLGLTEGEYGYLLQNSVAYKPTLHMYQYLSLILPMLLEFENFRESTVLMSRASRRKRVAYTEQPEIDVENDEYLGGADEDYSEEEQDEEYLD